MCLGFKTESFVYIGKREEVTHVGDTVTHGDQSPSLYVAYNRKGDRQSSHQTLCRAINKLEQRECDDIDQDSSLRVHVDELKGLVHECPPKTN